MGKRGGYCFCRETTKRSSLVVEIDKYSQVTGLKILIQSIPYIGTPLNEILFEHKGRIKQERLNKFLQNLKDYFETVNEVSINDSYINSEEFGDIFESVLEKVSKTSSEEKLKRFKQILIKQIEIPEKTEYFESFLDVISKITDKQFEILLTQYRYYPEYKIIRKEINQNEELLKNSKHNEYAEYDTYSEKLEILNNKRMEIEEKFMKFENYNIQKEEYLFLVQDLISKSLLYDAGLGYFIIGPFEIVLITDYGLALIKYISEN